MHLPSRRELELRIAFAESVVTVPAALVLVGVIASAVEFRIHHLELAGWLTFALTPVFLGGAWAFKRRALGSAFAWLDDRAAGGSGERHARSAFEQVMNFPRRMATFFGIAWLTVGLPVSTLFPILHDDFGVRPGAMLTAGAFCLGLIAVVGEFVLLKRVLGPMRRALTGALSDPVERAELIFPVSLRARLVAVLVALMLFTAYAMAVISTGRFSNETKALLVERQEAVLDLVFEEAAERRTLPSLGPEARALLDATGIELALVSPDGGETLLGETGLDERDFRFLAEAESRGRVTNASASNLVSYRRLGEEGPLLVAATPFAALRKGVAQGVWGIGLTVAAILGGGVALAMALAGDLTQGIRELRRSLERVAQGDLAAASSYEAEDEVGELSRATESMKQSLRLLLEEMTAAARELQATGLDLGEVSQAVGINSQAQEDESSRIVETIESISGQLDALSALAGELGDTSKASGEALEELKASGTELQESGSVLHEQASNSLGALQQISEGSGQVSASSVSLETLVEGVSDELAVLLQSIDEVGRNADESAAFSQQVIGLAREGATNVDRTVGGMREIRGASEEVAQAFQQLGESSDAIAEMAGVIKSVADETNLLSLNAAIIAAQSGEHGRAFAVVAGEIDSLARRVQSNSRGIQDLTARFDTRAEQAPAALARSSDAVAAGLELAGTSQRSLEQITETALRSAERAASIAGATADQSAGTKQLAGQMGRARGDMKAIREMAEEHRGACRVVARNAKRVGEVASELELSAADQAASGVRIAGAVEGLRRGAEQMTLAVGEQSAGCRELEQAVDNLRRNARAERESFASLREATDRLLQRAEALQTSVERFRL